MAEKRSLFQNLKIEAHAAWLAARDPRCPWGARAVGLLVAAYALSPIDLIPDFIPVIGLLDEHRAAAAQAAERPRSRLGLVIVLAIWALAALLTWQALRWAYA